MGNSENLMLSIINSPKDVIIFALDRNYRYLAFNRNHQQTMKTIWGSDIEIGLNMLDIIKDPGDREKAKKNFDRALRGEAFILIEEYGEPPNRFYYEDNYSPIFDDAGEVIGLSLFLTDITRNKQNEAELDQYRNRLESLVKQRTKELETVKNQLKQDITKRKKTAVQLKNTLRQLEASEERLDVTLHSIGDAVIATDKQGNITLMNPVAETLTGWTESDARDRPLKNVFPIINENTREPVEDPVQRVIREGTVIGLANHTLLIHRDGHEIPIADSGAPIRNARNKIIGVVLVFRDQTQERRAKRELSESEARFRTLSESASEGIAIHDKGIILDTNSTFCRLFGYEKKEVLGMNVLDFAAPESRDQVLNNVRRKYKKSYEAIGLRKDGTTFIGELIGKSIPYRDGTARATIIRDITEQKKIQREIIELTEFNEGILRDMAEGLVVMDADSLITYVNPAAGTLLGYPQNELLGQHSSNIIPEDQIPVMQAEDEKRKRGKSSVYELQMVRKDGRRIDLRVSGSPRFKEGKFIGTMAVFTDVTEQKRVIKALEVSETLNRTVLTSVEEGIVVYDRQFRYQVWNAYMESLTGLKAETVLGKYAFDVLPFLKEQGIDQYLNRALNGETLIGPDRYFTIPETKKEGWFVSTYAPRRGAGGTIEGVVVLVQEITERKQTLDALAESEAFNRTVLASVSEGVIVYDREFRYLVWNSFMETLTGMKAEDVLGKCAFDVFPFMKKQGMDTLLRRALQGEAITTHDIPYVIQQTGKRGWIVSNYAPHRDPDGKITGVVGLVRDITERKEAEQELASQRKTLADILEGTNAGTWDWNIQTGAVVINERWAEIIGYTLEELQPVDINTWINNVHPDDLPQANALLEKNFNRELDYYDVVFRQPHKNGGWVWVNARGKVIEWTEDGKPLRMSGIHIDVTDRKQAEEKIKRFSRIFEDSLNEIYLFDADTLKFIQVNSAAQNNLGYTIEELQALTPIDLKPEFTAASFAKLVKPLRKGEKKKIVFETIHKRKDQSLYAVEVHLQLLSFNENDVFAAIISDITERKAKEKEIFMLANSLKSIRECVSITDENNKLLFVNDAFVNTYGYSREELIGRSVGFIRSPLNSEETIKAILPATLRGGWQGEIFNRDKNGRDFPVQLSTSPVRDENGEIVALIGVAEDITERRAAEDTLRENELLLRTIADNYPNSYISIIEKDLTVSFSAGQEFKNQNLNPEDFNGLSIEDVFGVYGEDVLKQVRSAYQKTFRGKEQSFELFVNNQYQLYKTVPLTNKQGSVNRILVVVENITERRLAEKAVTESEKKYHRIFDNSIAAIYVFDTQKNFIDSNQAGLELLGYSREQLLGMNMSRVDADPVSVLPAHKQLLSGGKIVNYEHKLKRRDGKIITVLNNSIPLVDDNGALVGMQSTLIDITERKQAEEQLRQTLSQLTASEKQLKTIIETEPECIKILDPEGILLHMNRAGLDMIEAEALDQVKGDSIFPLIAPEYRDEFKAMLNRVIQGNKEMLTFDIIGLKGTRRRMESHSVPFTTDGKGVTGLLSVTRDITARLQAEEEVRRLSAVVKTTNQYVVMTTIDGRVIFVNEAYLKESGYTGKEVLGLSMFDFSTDSGTEILKNETIPALLSAGNWHGEMTVRRKNNSTFISDLNCILLTNEQKEPEYFVAVFEDITDRKTAEQTLKKREAELSESQSVARLGSWSWDMVNNTLEWSEETHRRFDTDPQTFTPTLEYFVEHIQTSDREKVQKAIQDAVENDIPYHVECWIRNDTGREWVMEAFGVVDRDEDGKPLGIHGTAQDITERKVIEDKLAENEERMRMLVEGTPYLFFYTQDQYANITYISPSVEQITGYTVEEWSHPDSNWFLTEAALNTEAMERSHSHLQGRLTEGPLLLEIRHKRGHPIQLEIYENILYQDGEVIGIQGVAHNITKRQQALEEAQRASRVKDLFLANMSHEIRTPLNSIVGFSELLENVLTDRIRDDERQYFEIIRSSSGRLMHTVHEILDISLIESGTYNLNLKAHDLVSTTRSIVNQFQTAAAEKEVKLVFTSTRKTAPILADEYGLDRILSNLIDNAIKYTHRGSVTVKLTKSKPNFQVEIRDTGIGISEDYLPQLYEIFSQESVGYTKKFQGIGLGMSLVKKYSDLQGIRVRVNSVKGRGTTFTLTIPERKTR